MTWLVRPSLESIETRAEDILATATPTPGSPASGTATEGTGRMTCVIDTQRSRVTVSDITDVPLEWSADGCVNGRAQYGFAQDGWTRILVPDGEETISVNRYDPATRTYIVERFLMGFDDMNKARAERKKIAAPACGAPADAARRFGEAQQAIKALLPAEPNERMRYNCQPQP